MALMSRRKKHRFKRRFYNDTKAHTSAKIGIIADIVNRQRHFLHYEASYQQINETADCKNFHIFKTATTFTFGN